MVGLQSSNCLKSLVIESNPPKAICYLEVIENIQFLYYKPRTSSAHHFKSTIWFNMEQVKNVPSYPKTGKRGVPQQFPRRLYNMLESESQLQQTAENLISWSESGKAFRIEDVTLFSTTVLPKYFRTSKFSSFQRNLNLVSEILAETKSWIWSPLMRTRTDLGPAKFVSSDHLIL